MYLGKRKILRPEEYEARRAKCIEWKADAVLTACSELEDLINVSQLAAQYFDESPDWISGRLRGCMCDRTRAFSEEEYHQLANAFRDIAKRLLAHADEIDTAEMDE